MNTQFLVNKAKKLVILKEYKTKQNHVAFIFEKNKLISVGNNKAKTHPIMSKYFYGNHIFMCAEIDAIIKAKINDFSNCTMTVLRIRPTGKLAMSKPCNGCQNLIKKFNFKEVFYSTNAGTIEELKLI